MNKQTMKKKLKRKKKKKKIIYNLNREIPIIHFKCTYTSSVPTL